MVFDTYFSVSYFASIFHYFLININKITGVHRKTTEDGFKTLVKSIVKQGGWNKTCALLFAHSLLPWKPAFSKETRAQEVVAPDGNHYVGLLDDK